MEEYKTSDFARLITLLRKEAKISQKKASVDLGVSQALLSHYEKGIRECGLSFLVKVADYYGVSCDYLLGRTLDREGKTIEANEIADGENEIDNTRVGSIVATLAKKININGLNVIYDILSDINNKKLTTEVTNQLNIIIYKIFRMIYNANEENDQNMFCHDKSFYLLAANKGISECDIKILKLLNTNVKDCIKSEKIPKLNQETINEKYKKYASSLLSLLQNAESKIK